MFSFSKEFQQKYDDLGDSFRNAKVYYVRKLLFFSSILLLLRAENNVDALSLRKIEEIYVVEGLIQYCMLLLNYT